MALDFESLPAAPFYDLLFGEQEGYVSLGMIPEDELGGERSIRFTEWFEWPAQRSHVLAKTWAYREKDLYVRPQLFHVPTNNKVENVKYAGTIYVDGDTAAPEVFLLEPSIILATSPGKWQYHWLLTETMAKTWIEEAAEHITKAHIEDGSDKGTWALGRWFRVPGTRNCKRTLDEDFDVTMEITGRVYEAAEVAVAYEVSEPITAEQWLQEHTPRVGRVIKLGLELMDLPAESDLPSVQDAIEKVPEDPAIDRLRNRAPIGSWYPTLWALECMLFRHGLSAPEVFVLVRGCACDKFTRDGRPESDLWKDVLKAEQYAPQYTSEQMEESLEAAHGGADFEAYIAPPVDVPQFITDAERQLVADYPDFITKYMDWAKTKTNADPNYHAFGAMSLLSTVLSDFGHAVPAFGPLKLNMWFMLLGVTTRTYKTTSRKLMLRVLRGLEDEDAGFDYRIGSDTTPEGLLLELAEYPGRSKFFYRDEVQGLLGDMRGGKSHLSGLGETFTELYDGNVRGRLRATGTSKKTREVETSFNMYLMGVPGKTAQILNPEDFASGFLARFLYVIGVPEERTEQTMYLQQQKEHDINVEDKGLKLLQGELLAARKFWMRQTDPGDTMPIRVEEDAWQRFNEFIKQLTLLGEDDPDSSEQLAPVADRINKSVLKLACLLAMVDAEKTVSLRYMLRAIEWAELWWYGVTQMVEMVRTSVWAQQIRDVTDIVTKAKDSFITYGKLYRSFMHLRPKDFRELVDGAVQAGYIMTARGDGGAEAFTIQMKVVS